MSGPTLYYWKFKGRNYHIQAIAQAGGLDLQIFPDMNFAEMRAAGFYPFDQVPVLVDGDIKIGQCNAIFRYFARKAGLEGDTDTDFAMSEMLIEEATEIWDLARVAFRKPDKNAAYDELFADGGELSKHLTNLEKLLEADKVNNPSFFKGDKRFAGEYVVTAMLDFYTGIEPNFLHAHPKLREFYIVTLALPAWDGIRNYPIPKHILRNPV